MNPHDFLDLADTLSLGADEAEWRTAASRAYYAAFHVARRLLKDSGFVVLNSDKAHAFLWFRLGNCGHPDVEDVGRSLNDMRSVRNKADYDLDRPFDQRLARDLVQFALSIIQLLETVAATPTVRATITEAMKLYERDVLKDVTWRP